MTCIIALSISLFCDNVTDMYSAVFIAHDVSPGYDYLQCSIARFFRSRLLRAIFCVYNYNDIIVQGVSAVLLFC